MDSVLGKTVTSLESALRYNPDNIELTASLAEGYIRMGRLDETTIALCEKVLSAHPDNQLLHQAQAASYVIDQVDRIDDGLLAGKEPPEPEVIGASIEMLEELMEVVEDSSTLWFSWTRLCILACRLEAANRGIARLKQCKFDNLAGLRRSVDWIARKKPVESMDWVSLHYAYEAIGEPGMGLKMLETAYDQGTGQAKIGPLLLRHYLDRYSSSNPGEVPEGVRSRLFQTLLDHGNSEITAEWLRKASLYGWEVNSFTKSYVRELIRDEQMETALEMLQRMSIDDEVRAMLNEIAVAYEDLDRIDDAVLVLRYINDHVLTEEDVAQKRESELTCEMELSLAELHLKNGRIGESLGKFISALCLKNEPEPAIVERIDEILASSGPADPNALLRLAAYFRQHKDHPKTVYYLNRILEHEPEHAEALHELETLFDELLQTNPDNPQLRLELGRLYLQTDRLDEAIQAFELAAETPTLTNQARRHLAQAHHKAGRLRQALDHYQEAELAEADLDPLYELHLDLIREKDENGALAALRCITRIRADFRDVAHRIKDLDERAAGSQPQIVGDPKMQELIGDLAVGRYRYEERIGSGGMGVVHRVFDDRLGQVVAMKILRDGLGGSSKALDRFFREARIATTIRHRNIVEIYDYNISSVNGQSYICMECIEGPSLRQTIDQQFEETISVGLDYITEMLFYVIQVFDALDATHAKKIIHRDIKPDNIMITLEGEVKITDFGIVHVEEATFTPTGAMLGTPRYMSPEQVTGARIDGRSDIYSTGILLYEVLTGSPPFMTGDISYQQVNKQPAEPRAINPAIPEPVNAFIMRCLEKLPDDRFANAKEARLALARVLAGLGGCQKYEHNTAVGHTDVNKQPEPSAPEPVKELKLDPDLDIGFDTDSHNHTNDTNDTGNTAIKDPPKPPEPDLFEDMDLDL